MATEAEQKEAMAKISEQVAVARAAIQAAEKLADAAGVTFGFSMGYGMGGTYYPKLTQEQRDAAKAEAEKNGDWYDSYEDEGWQSSSSRC